MDSKQLPRRGLEDEVRRLVREEVAASLAARRGEDDDWLPHPRWGVAPSARAACALAKSGAIPARKVGRVWLARRRDLDAYVEAHAEPAAAETGSIVDFALARRRRSA